MDIKFLYKVHKWLALFVGALTLSWFVSGAAMALPQSWSSFSAGLSTDMDAESRLPGAPGFDEASVAPSAAIAAVEARSSTPLRITAVTLRRLPGRLAYDIATADRGRHLVDAMDGTTITIDEDFAKQIVARFLGPAFSLGPVTMRSEWTAFRVPVLNGKGTVAYVDRATGETQLTDPLRRVTRAVTRFHELGFLYSVVPPTIMGLVFLVMTIAGTLMTLAGMLILLAQFQRWRRSHRIGAAR